jgi:putative hemolysin
MGRKLSRPEAGPVSLDDVEFEHRGLRFLWEMAKPALERATGLAELAEAYRRAEDAATVESFLARIFAELGLRWHVNELDLARIPRSGGCLVVANHPFGAVEGMVLAAMMRSVRADAKILANHLLERLPPLRDALIFVDPFGRRSSTTANVGAVRSAVRSCDRAGCSDSFRPARWRAST